MTVPFVNNYLSGEPLLAFRNRESLCSPSPGRNVRGEEHLQLSKAHAVDPGVLTLPYYRQNRTGGASDDEVSGRTQKDRPQKASRLGANHQ
jgi:hypothetical protein